MKAYMIVFAHVTRPQDFKAYSTQTAQLLPQFGGQYITIGRQADVLEGEFGQGMSVVISQWPSREAVDAFWNSESYQELKKLRAGCGTFHVTVVEDLLAVIQAQQQMS